LHKFIIMLVSIYLLESNVYRKEDDG
jgi:hypothetical protein